MSIETVNTHWDCECKENYIHDKTVKVCIKCNAVQEDQPDSLENEVKSHLTPSGLKVVHSDNEHQFDVSFNNIKIRFVIEDDDFFPDFFISVCRDHRNWEVSEHDYIETLKQEMGCNNPIECFDKWIEQFIRTDIARFSNGFDSWIETYYEVVEKIVDTLNQNTEDSDNVISERQAKEGRGGLI